MKTFSFKCTCGDIVTTDAMDKASAVEKFKAMMTPDFVKSHFAEKHKGAEVPPMEVLMAGVESSVFEGDLTASAQATA